MAKNNKRGKLKPKKVDETKLFNQVIRKTLSWMLASNFYHYNNKQIEALELTMNKLLENYKFQDSIYTKTITADYVTTQFMNALFEIMYFSKNHKEENLILKSVKVEKIIRKLYEDIESKKLSIGELSSILFFRNAFNTTNERALYDNLNIKTLFGIEYNEFLTELFSDLINSIEFISTYIFVLIMKPKNNLIDSFQFKSKEILLIKYNSKRFITFDDISYYNNCETGALNMLSNRVIQRSEERSFREYMLCFVKIYSSYRQYHFETGEALIPLKIPGELTLPFAKADCTLTENNEYKLKLETNIKPSDFLNLKNKKKYAMPSDGCIINFLRDDVCFKSALVQDLKHTYKFTIDFKENIFTGEGDVPVNSGVFYFNKEDLNDFINVDITEDDFIISNNSSLYYSEESQPIENISNTNSLAFILSLNICLVGCLHTIYVDINNSDVQLCNVEHSNNRMFSARQTSYKTAYIRRLPNGWNASEEAKQRAKAVDIILPQNYTFVREHIPEDEKAIRTINIK